MHFIQILLEVEVVEPHFEVDMEVRMVDIINMKVSLMEVDKKFFKEGDIIEVVEIIKVNNQTSIQTTTIAGNLGTWQIIIIKGNMMHEMESCNKNYNQLVIKVMNNYL